MQKEPTEAVYLALAIEELLRQKEKDDIKKQEREYNG